MTIKLSDRAMIAMQELIPEHMHGAVIRYFEQGYQPGHFLTALLAGDLFEAVSRADEPNRRALHGYCVWLHNYVPGRPNGWGSYQAVEEWVQEADKERFVEAATQ